jgi:hypothetical protein
VLLLLLERERASERASEREKGERERGRGESYLIEPEPNELVLLFTMRL